MSLGYLFEFQLSIYDLMLSHNYIRRNCRGVYVAVQQDGYYPYVVINDFNAENISKHGKSQYLVDFNVYVFVQHNNLAELLKLGDEIVKALTPSALKYETFKILNLNHRKLKIRQATDLVTTKLELLFQSHIQENIS